jgi:hypothetical protein
MRPLRLIGALGTLVVSVALLSEYGCTTSGDIKPPPQSTSASGGSGYPGTAQGGTTSVDTNTGGTAPTTGGTVGTGGLTSCSDPLLTLCSNECVNTGTDRKHCGGCTTACGETEICTDGQCGCPASNSDGAAGPITEIDGTCVPGECVDLRSSDVNCGACYITCGKKRCIDGICDCKSADISCNKDVLCSSASDPNCGCYDPLTDENHCGDCATKCGQYEKCDQGACVLDCAASNRTECNGQCVDTQNNSTMGPSGKVENCGSCGISCPTDRFECKNGECVCSATAILPTVAHCMLEGTDPPDVCVDTATDSRYCGNCETACTSGHVCENSQCVCSSTSTLCGDNCYDLTSDSKHCGDCSKACGVGEHCASSACVCTAPLESCSGRCADFQTEAANCGGCGKPCGTGQACTAGACQCDTGQDLCSGACYNLQTEKTHCGDCATHCSAAQTCEAGKCTCGSDLTACDQDCVDAQNDAQNCGGCGKTCTGTQMCQGGACKTSILKVRSQGQADSSKQQNLMIYISVCNASGASLSLSGMTLKYWFTEDGVNTALAVAVDWGGGLSPAPTATAEWLDVPDFKVNAHSVLTVTFGANTLATGACTDAIQMRVHPADNMACCFDPQAGDYSYSAATTMTDNPKITAYSSKGLLIWGLEPAPEKP